MDIIKELFALSEEKYADFTAKLNPNISRENVIGVRVPKLRILAKKVIKEGEWEEFVNNLPHKYFDENLLHSIILSNVKDFDTAMALVEKFLPYVDNWAVCDTLNPKIFAKNKPKLLKALKVWSASEKVYTCRFGVDMLMTYFLDGDFLPEYLEIPAKIRSDEYYVNMMRAWFYATALAKQWESTVPYIEKARLDKFTHNKTIRKAIESYRITDEQKTYLRTLTV